MKLSPLIIQYETSVWRVASSIANKVALCQKPNTIEHKNVDRVSQCCLVFLVFILVSIISLIQMFWLHLIYVNRSIWFSVFQNISVRHTAHRTIGSTRITRAVESAQNCNGMSLIRTFNRINGIPTKKPIHLILFLINVWMLSADRGWWKMYNHCHYVPFRSLQFHNLQSLWIRNFPISELACALARVACISCVCETVAECFFRR